MLNDTDDDEVYYNRYQTVQNKRVILELVADVSELDEELVQVRLTHPKLGGELLFCVSTKLVEGQLEALSFCEEPQAPAAMEETPLMSIINDVANITKIATEMKPKIDKLRKKR